MTRLLLVLLLVASSGTGHAEPTPMSDAARAYFERGEALYAAGDYARAIEELERGQRLEPHPDFLYVLGQTYRKQGDCQKAVAQYQAFLATQPSEAEAVRASANIVRAIADAWRARKDEEAARTQFTCPARAPTPAPPPPPPLRTERPWYRDRVGGVLAGAAVLGLAAGATFLVRGEQYIRRANEATTLKQVEELGAQGDRARTIGTVCIIAGGALAVGAAVRYVTRPRRRSTPTTAIAVSPQATSLVLLWGGAF